MMSNPLRMAALAATALFLQAPLASADTKVAVVDMMKVLHSTTKGKAAQKAFDDLKAKRLGPLEKAEKSLKKREQDLAKTKSELEQAGQALQGKPLTDDLKKRITEFQEGVQKWQQDLMEFEGKQRSAGDELAKKESELIKPIRDAINQKVEAIAKEQNIAVVLTKDMVLFANAAVDITAEVIKRCDAP